MQNYDSSFDWAAERVRLARVLSKEHLFLEQHHGFYEIGCYEASFTHDRNGLLLWIDLKYVRPSGSRVKSRCHVRELDGTLNIHATQGHLWPKDVRVKLVEVLEQLGYQVTQLERELKLKRIALPHNKALHLDRYAAGELVRCTAALSAREIEMSLVCTCTRCNQTGFLNLHQIPESESLTTDEITSWISSNEIHDVQVCDCCGDGENWHGQIGVHHVGEPCECF